MANVQVTWAREIGCQREGARGDAPWQYRPTTTTSGEFERLAQPRVIAGRCITGQIGLRRKAIGPCATDRMSGWAQEVTFVLEARAGKPRAIEGLAALTG